MIQILELLAYVDEVGQGTCGVEGVGDQDGPWETLILTQGGREEGTKESEEKTRAGDRNRSAGGGK